MQKRELLDQAISHAESLRKLLKDLDVDLPDCFSKFDDAFDSLQKKLEQEDVVNRASKLYTAKAGNPEAAQGLEEAIELLKKAIRASNQKTIEGFARFIAFLEKPASYSSTNKGKLFRELEGMIPEKLLYAVFFGDAESAVSLEKPEENTPDEAPGQASGDAAGKLSDSAPELKKGTDRAEPPEEETTDTIHDEMEEVPDEENPFERYASVFYPSDYRPENWIEETPSQKSKKMSVSIFSSNFRSLPPFLHTAARNAAYMIQQYGLCYAEQFRGLTEQNQVALDSILEHWFKMDLLVRCSFNGKTFYKYNDKFLSILQSEKVCNLLSLQASESKNMHKGFDCLRTAASLARSEFDKVISTCLGFISYSFASVYFAASSAYNEINGGCLFVSVYSLEIAKLFFDALTEHLQELETPPAHLLVTGFDFTHARACAEMISTEIGCLSDCRTVLHELAGGYATYPDMERIEDEEAWALLGLSQEQEPEDEGTSDDDEPEVNEDREAPEMAAHPAEKDEVTTPNASTPSSDEAANPSEDTVGREEEPQIPEETPEAQSSLSLDDPVPTVHKTIPPQEMDDDDDEDPYPPDKHDIYLMLRNSQMYCAYWYAYAAGTETKYPRPGEDWLAFADRLAYAVNAPGTACQYTGDRLYSLLVDDSTKPQGLEAFLFVATALRAIFYNHSENDYFIVDIYEETIKNLPLLSQIRGLGSVFYSMISFRKSQYKGLEPFTDLKHRDSLENEKEMKEICREAKECYDNYFSGRIRENAKFERYVKTQQLIFKDDGDLGNCLTIVAEGKHDSDSLDMLKALLSDFMEDGDNVNVASFSMKEIDAFIDRYWDQAADELFFSKKRTPLVGGRRERLRNRIDRVLGIIQHWLRCADRLDVDMTDHEAAMYRKTKSELLPHIDEALQELQNINLETEDEEIAGHVVLENVLREIRGYLEGVWDNPGRNHEFLLTDNVYLGNDGKPCLSHDYDELPGLSILLRLVNHSKQISQIDTKDKAVWSSRLDRLMEKGLDYGAVAAIANYMHSQGWIEPQDIADLKIEECVQHCLQEEENKLRDFLRKLELWQSYGRISTISGQKDHLKRLAEQAYDFAKEETHDFGFFDKVLIGCEQLVDYKASKRGDRLRGEYEELKKSMQESDKHDAAMQCMAKVQEMMAKQNFTVAEGMMNGMKRGEFFNEQLQLNQHDLLGSFLKNYDLYYQDISDSTRYVQDILRRTGPIRNKEDVSGNELVRNWMGGMRDKPQIPPDENRLKKFLTQLEFKVASISPSETWSSNSVNKVMTWQIVLDKTQGHHSHPIAAFGSQAMEFGFRLALVRGRYRADGLLSIMSTIQDTQHTIIMQDWALPLDERKRLARKVKEAGFVHVFAVLDRVLLDFLVKNYKTFEMQSMLMQLLMPFANCQPYVPESSKKMPPEMFKGRREELQKIKDPAGVNVVYGGRQLGKSALLNMACMEINNNVRGDRAVYVSVKDCDYCRTAQRVSECLLDEGILLEDNFKHDDWHELTRAIQLRLRDTKNPIPYLLLLIDEGDAFLESSAKISYQPIDSLKELMGFGQGRFKFVIAGLRNVVRFDKTASLGNNASITHLSPLTVRPFSNVEARELLEDPLRYLGIYFDNEEFIYLICSSANYFPGLIQLYCEKLIKAISVDYAGYDEINTPKYVVGEEQLQRVLADPEFIRQVKEKFMITLWLDKDNIYYIIALLIARLYHDQHLAQGYSAEEIKNEGKAFGIPKIVQMSKQKLTAFLDEMCDLYILSCNDDRYLFSMDNFVELMGSYNAIDDALMEVMQEEDT